MAHIVRVFASSLMVAIADLRAIYTWRTWAFGWVLRVSSQVAFFALIGAFVGSQERMRFLLVGMSVTVAAMSALNVIASTSWERRAGTLPLLIASPAKPVVIFVGRSAEWILDGTVTALVAFLIVAPAFGMTVTGGQVAAVAVAVAIVAVSSYSFGLFLAALVLRSPSIRNLALNLTYLLLIAVTGVTVPREFLPEPLPLVASLLPLTHGVEAVRMILAGGEALSIVQQAAFELLLGIAWLAIAVVGFDRFVESARKAGSLELGG